MNLPSSIPQYLKAPLEPCQVGSDVNSGGLLGGSWKHLSFSIIIVWQRFCEPCQTKNCILSVSACVLSPIKLFHCYKLTCWTITNWWSIIAFARHRWPLGLFISIQSSMNKSIVYSFFSLCTQNSWKCNSTYWHRGHVKNGETGSVILYVSRPGVNFANLIPDSDLFVLFSAPVCKTYLIGASWESRLEA